MGAFKGWLWFYVKLKCVRVSERLAGAKGQAERERGLPTLCESGRERSVGRAERALVGVRKRWHGQARVGTQIYLRGGLAVAVFPHPLNCHCFAFGQRACIVVASQIAWGNFNGFFYSFLALGVPLLIFAFILANLDFCGFTFILFILAML